MNGRTTSYQVTVTTDHDHPLTQSELTRLAQLGGVATSDGGRRRTMTTVDVELNHGEQIDAAGSEAVNRVQRIAPGHTVAVEILTLSELGQRPTEPTFPELAGLAEAAEILGLTRQRASFLHNRPGFPAPVAVLHTGPVWRKADLYEFADARRRPLGRPRRLATAR